MCFPYTTIVLAPSIMRYAFHDSLPAALWDELDNQNDENQWKNFEI